MTPPEYTPQPSAPVQSTTAILCPICGVVPTTVYCRQLDLLREAGACERFTMMRCARCGLLFQSPRPADLLNSYDGSYPPHDSTPRPRWVRLLWDLLDAWFYRSLRSLLPDQARILEIGCGTGVRSHAFRRGVGWSYMGIEVSPDAAAVARAAGFQVLCGDARQAAELDGRFDLIYLNHVFEHLEDPLEILEILRSKIAERGVLLLTVPNLDSLEGWVFGSYWVGLDLPRHLWVFSPSTLAQMLVRSKFRVVQTSHSARPTGIVGSLDCLLRARGWRGLSPLTRRLLLLCFLPFGCAEAVLRRGGSITVLARPSEPEADWPRSLAKEHELRHPRSGLDACV